VRLKNKTNNNATTRRIVYIHNNILKHANYLILKFIYFTFLITAIITTTIIKEIIGDSLSSMLVGPYERLAVGSADGLCGTEGFFTILVRSYQHNKSQSSYYILLLLQSFVRRICPRSCPE